MNTYTQLDELAQTRKRKLGNNTYLVIRDDNGYGIRLHDTEVVIHYEDKIVLDSGGYKTVRKSVNGFLAAGYAVYTPNFFERHGISHQNRFETWTKYREQIEQELVEIVQVATLDPKTNPKKDVQTSVLCPPSSAVPPLPLLR